MTNHEAFSADGRRGDAYNIAPEIISAYRQLGEGTTHAGRLNLSLKLLEEANHPLAQFIRERAHIFARGNAPAERAYLIGAFSMLELVDFDRFVHWFENSLNESVNFSDGDGGEAQPPSSERHAYLPTDLPFLAPPDPGFDPEDE